MRLRQIEVFHAVYTSGSVTQAAALLHVSQPSVSKVLAHAEQQLGYALFDRLKGKLVPTAEAHRLFGLVASVYQHVDELRQVARNLRASDDGRIRIGATPAFGIDLLPGAVAHYLRSHPDTVFEIETLHHGGIQSALTQSRLDIGLCFEPEPSPALAVEPLASAEFMVLTPPEVDLAQGGRLRIQDISHLPFIGLNSRGPLGRLLNTYLDSSKISLNVVALAETYHLASGLVANGAGATIVDAITAASTAGNKVRAWPLSPPLEFTICALHFADVPLSRVARQFLDHLAITVTDFLATRLSQKQP